MEIYTFGDSHAYNGWEVIDTYKLKINMHNIGAKLCYSFGRDKLNCLNIKDYNVRDNSIVIFCFGEIDCRCHIYKHISPEKSYETIIDEIVKNYFIAVEENVKQFNKLKVAIYNVVPPVQRHNTGENPEYPYLGLDDERKEYVLYFNKKLKEYCEKYNYHYFDIYNYYCDENGFLKKNLSDGNVHILHPVFIYQQLIDYIIYVLIHL
jgi:hypothetical protein